MNYLRKMSNNIRMEALGKGMIAGGVISLFYNLLSMFAGFDIGWFYPILSAFLSAAVCGLIGVLFSLRKTSALNKRVRSLERISGPIREDMITQISNDTAIGDKWLIWKKGTLYRLWTTDILDDVALESENPSSKKAVLILKTKNGKTDKCIVTKSMRLQEWVEKFKFVQPEIV